MDKQLFNADRGGLWIGFGVGDDGFNLHAKDTPGCINFFNGEELGFHHWFFANRHRSRQGMENTDPYRLFFLMVKEEPPC